MLYNIHTKRTLAHKPRKMRHNGQTVHNPTAAQLRGAGWRKVASINAVPPGHLQAGIEVVSDNGREVVLKRIAKADPASVARAQYVAARKRLRAATPPGKAGDAIRQLGKMVEALARVVNAGVEEDA